jgi:hypothetical protein
MMSDNFWEDITNLIYDAINNELYTEEERNALIEDAFSSFAGFTVDADSIPGNFRFRSHTFYSPIDLVYWVEDAGVPTHYVYIHQHTSVRDNSVQYNVYISNS